jgi:hypothetical protein
VLCVDEKSQIQAIDRTRPSLPMTYGMPEMRTHGYRRYGTRRYSLRWTSLPDKSSALRA